MLMSKMKIILLCLLILLGGCGDLMKKEVVKRTIDSTQFQTTCELNPDVFSKIISEKITSQIRCLGENLNLFIKVVKSEKPGYLSRIQLEKYLKNNRPDVSPQVIRALKSFFALSALITGDEPDFISQQNVNEVINFVITFNEEASQNFAPIFENESPISYTLHQTHRERVSVANKIIVQALRKIYKTNRNGRVDTLDLMELINSFESSTTTEEIQKLKKMLFIKKIVLGGEKDIITHEELEKLIYNFDNIVLIGLDAVRYKYIILKQDSLMQLLKRDVNDFYDVLFQGANPDDESKVIFTLSEATEMAKIFVDKDFLDLDKMTFLISEIKRIVMGGDQNVKREELRRLLNHSKNVLQTGTIFHRIYEKFKIALDSPLPVTIDFSDYRTTYPEHIKELNQFERIVKKYRFMKGNASSAYFTRGFRRNADGVVEIALLEYAIELLFKEFGSKSPNADAVGGYSMSSDQVYQLFKRFENELIDLNLLMPLRARGASQNITLLGSLFQYQADTNKVLDINEAAEFGVTVFSAIRIADDMMKFMKTQGCRFDEFNRVEPGCFRKNFWNALCSDYKNNFPLLLESIGHGAVCEENQETDISLEFLDKSLRVARTCMFYPDGEKEEIPYSKSDLMVIMVAMLHAETTVLRWDLNSNNFMDADEVNQAYEIYSPALDGFLSDKPDIIKRFKRQIYQYLIRYETVPNEDDFGSIRRFVTFLLRFNKNYPAYRRTITSILLTIGEQSALTSTEPQIDCKYLRDPNHIPRDPSAHRQPNPTKPISVETLLNKYIQLAK